MIRTASPRISAPRALTPGPSPDSGRGVASTSDEGGDATLSRLAGEGRGEGTLGARLFSLLILLAFALCFARTARAADPIDPKTVPDPLKPWVAWALDGKDDRSCAFFLGHADVSRCAWPSSLSLILDDHGGRFSQKWHMDKKAWVPLPGDDKRWPNDVKVDGAAAVVLLQGGGPAVSLAPGDHEVSGSFAWDSMPEALKVPVETGLLALSLRGAVVPSPNRSAEGTVFLQKAAKSEEGNALEFVVHRRIQDDVPVLLTTRVELRVAGKNREELLGKPLPPGFVPTKLDSPLPARLEPDGHLRVQVRPGVFILELTARSTGPLAKLTRPAPEGPWREGEEVWVFEANPNVRVVTVEGVASIDPQQTTLPDDWKRLPAYPLKVGDTLTFDEKRRGDEAPPPDQLSLSRTLWLDFDGTGYSVKDSLTGTLNRESRLTMAAPTVLGRVSIAGRDQFITKMNGSQVGVEIRQGELSVDADSRIPGDASDIPAVGWAHDFHQVSGTLHLPPGWSLLHASGVDEVPGTWIRRWSLLEVFLALVVAIGMARLYGVPWGAATLATLVLTLPEEGAPRWSWLFVLAAEALFRVLPHGRMKQFCGVLRVAAVLVVTIVALPFALQEVRAGLYPALKGDSAGLEYGGLADHSVANEGGDGRAATAPQAAAQAPMPPPVPEPTPIAVPPHGVMRGMGGGAAASARPSTLPAQVEDALDQDNDKEKAPDRSRGPWAKSGYMQQQSNAAVYDPQAIVQTGPGVPRWQWSSFDLKWSGPVAATQRLHLYLVPPWCSLVLGLFRALLLFAVVLRLFPWVKSILPSRLAGAAFASGLFLVLLASPARAQVPDKPVLEELASRLSRTPDCSPACASSGRMAIEVEAGSLRARMEVDAAAPTAVPLPGATGQFTPTLVLLSGQPAKAIARVDGSLWIEIPKGHSQLTVEGPMPDGETLQLALPLKPHRVEAKASGWTVAGLHEDGLADDVLEFTRVRTSKGVAGASLEPGTLPPFVRVERTLEVGLNWQVETHIVRVTPPGAAVVLDVPLLPGESVTTADVRVEGGKAKVNMGAKTTEIVWRSTLEQKSPVKLEAPRSVSWFEVWRVDVSPVWHASYAGIPFVHTAKVSGAAAPEWQPWPGEEAKVELVRPEGVPGQTLTIDESRLDVRPGVRATDVTLVLEARSSRGTEHTFTLPDGAQLESLSINGAQQPIRQDGRKVTVPLVPGQETITLVWRETPGIEAFFSTPSVDVGAPSVNATTVVDVPGGRWILWVSGPRVGPAVLFWGLMLVLLFVSMALGRSTWTPMRAWQWFLLSIGLSQVSVVAGAVFVGWLFAIGWRGRHASDAHSGSVFNLRQMLLAAWTLAALVILGISLYQGLLGAPEMQLAGNGSTADALRWFTDRSGATLPRAHFVSVPLMVYRAAMLGWALWVALALLGWLRWGWGQFSSGGVWKKNPPRPRPFPGGPFPQPSGPASPGPEPSTPEGVPPAG
jgi:hypothetical protein